jgi:nucleoside-diphosphate kinase
VPGTIRKLFADNKGENIIHGSDSAENGKIEIGYFFSNKEIIELE